MKTTSISLILLAISATQITACGVGEASAAIDDEAEMSTPVPVEVAYPAREDIFATYHATTTIGSEGDAPVLARVPGELVELFVEEGDWVEEGQVLARLDGERLRLEMLSAKANLDMARGEYERYVDLNRRGLVSEAMFDGLKYDLEALEASYQLKKLNYEYSNIRATISGFVSERLVKLGENLPEGHEAFRITDTSELIAYLQIPQTELEKFATGHTATLNVDSMPGSVFAAEIVRVSPTIDVRNGTFRATAFIDNSHGQLAPGMFARFEIAYEMHEDAMTIPTEALVLEDEQASVYVVADGQVTRRDITVGIESDGRIEIIGGLGEDEQIVIVGHSALRDGSRVLASTESSDRYTG